MTNREKEVFDLIIDNPMIAQNEIAEVLGITRSSVSVYIANLLKKGIILGRGYVVADENYPVIIGSANVDFISTIDQNIPQQDGNPFITENSDLVIGYGGTAKNISENLLRLGMNPKVIFAVGTDVFGDEIIRECKEHGICTDAVLVDPNSSTSIYIEVRNRQMESLSMGLANVGIQKLLTPAFLENKFTLLKKAQQILIEDGLQNESLNYLTSTFQQSQRFLLASRTNRIERYIGLLDRFSLLHSSLEIAGKIAGMPSDYSKDPDEYVIEAVRRLTAMGVKSIFIPYGKDRICYKDNSRCVISKFSETIHRTGIYSHYRDTTMAALMYCLANDFSLADTLLFVSTCRIIAVQTPHFVNSNLCLNMVDVMAKSCSVDIQDVSLD